MKFNKTVIVTLISLSSLMGISGSVLAQPGMGHNMNRGGGYAANLTAEQQAIYQKAFDNFQTATANLHQQLLSKQYEQTMNGEPKINHCC